MSNKNISGFMYIVLKSMDYVFKMSIFQKLSIVLYSVHWYMYMFMLKRVSMLQSWQIGQ